MPKLLLDASLLVLFFLGADCDKGLPVAPTDGDTLITVERELTDGEQPAVSPDGRRIAYSYKGDIYVMDTSGANIIQLTTGAETDFMPRWHPNGITIGFLRMPPGENDNAGISTVPATGGATTQIPLDYFVSNVLKRETEAYSGNGMPLWDYSPDGKYVAFLSKEGSKTYLNITMVSGAQHVLHREIYDDVTGINGNTSCFAWSLNPDEIAFIAENEQRTAYPHLLNFSSNTLLRDTTVTTPAYITRAPLSNRFAYKGGGLPSQGGPFTNVTDFSTPTIQYPTSGGGGLKWSPDEKFFLYEWQGTVGGAFGYDYSQLYLYSIDKGKYYRLTKKGDINRNNFYFEWAKTGNQVFFERFGKICAVEFRLPE